MMRIWYFLFFPVLGQLYSCNFESSDPTCGLIQVNSQTDSRYGRDQFDWTLRSGPTPTMNTGPPTDHTTGNTNGNKLSKAKQSS